MGIMPEGSSDYNPENASDDCLKQFRHVQPTMPTPIQKAETKAVGSRLRLFRMGLADFKEHYGWKTLRTFADETRVDEDNLTNWELGRSLVPNYYVQRLKEQFGVSYLFEWIYGADESGLPGRLAKSIREAAKPRLVEPKKAKRKSRAA